MAADLQINIYRNQKWNISSKMVSFIKINGEDVCMCMFGKTIS